MRDSSMRHVGAVLWAVATWLPLSGQEGDIGNLRINEVMADNNAVPPSDALGGTPDMVEIYNADSNPVDLTGVALSDTMEFAEALLTTPLSVYFFRDGVEIPGGESLLVFCDGQTKLDCVEPHVPFQIDADGNEPLTLWGPEVKGGTRVAIDQVILPPLRGNTSFGRYPDGAGLAPVPLDQTFETFHFFPVPSFAPPLGEGKSCSSRVETCSVDGVSRSLRDCFGSPNPDPAASNLSPRVSRKTQSTNSAAIGEAVEFTARVRDDKIPVPPNIANVELIHRVVTNGSPGPWLNTPMEFQPNVGDEGILTGADAGRPLDRWSEWIGSIPAQDKECRVEFYFQVEDAEGGIATRPLELCFQVLTDPPKNNFCDVQLESAADIGPCDSEFGGPGCEEDPCAKGKFLRCDVPLSFAVGYTPRAEVEGLVINEVVAGQRHDPDNGILGIIRDPTATDALFCSGTDVPKYCCRQGGANPSSPSCGYEDYIELVNASGTQIDLSGLWLADSFFVPETWQFPPNSTINPGERIIVWCDDDGDKCPADLDPEERPKFWECPNPNSGGDGLFHTTFELNGQNDQAFLFDTEENNYGLIHGVTFRGLTDNVALSLCPDGDPTGSFVAIPGGSPAAPNEPLDSETHCGDGFDNDCDGDVDMDDGDCQVTGVGPFLRGDCDGNGVVGGNPTEAIILLNFAFRGSEAPQCLAACDAEANGAIGVTDATRILRHSFLGMGQPDPPFPDCTESDKQSDLDIGCVEPTTCPQ